MATMKGQSFTVYFYEGRNNNASITFIFQVPVTVVDVEGFVPWE
jgi:hypothetical protein